MTDYVWFITAASSGFGKAIAFETLRRGHMVIATARNSAKLDGLKAAGAVVMDLNVTSDDVTWTSKLAEAGAIYGKITHVVNAAGQQDRRCRGKTDDAGIPQETARRR